MALSGSYDWKLNANEIVTQALLYINAIAGEETPTNDEMVNGRRTLNGMLKAWQAEGIGLWLNKEIILFIQADDIDYSLGPSGDNCALVSDAIKTELGAAAAAAATDMTVDSITGIANGDYIGVETSNGDIHWTTVNGAPAGTTVVLTTGLDYAAAIDSHVYAYTTKIQRPLEIIEARRVDENDNETPLYIASRNEYMSISDKTSEGTINQIYYDGQLTNGVLYVWPEPNNMKDRIKMTVKYPIQDFDAATNDADLPQEWTEALIFNLALRESIKYGKTINSDLRDLAIISKNIVAGFDREDTSIYIQPGYRDY